MDNIKTYILEKLHINKNTKVDLRKYMVTFGVSGNGVLFRVDDSLEDIKAYIKRNNISKKNVYVFKFPLELQNELLDKCEDNYNDNISWAELIIWCEKNNIGYIGRDYVFNESLIDEKLHINKDAKFTKDYGKLKEIIDNFNKEKYDNTLKYTFRDKNNCVELFINNKIYTTTKLNITFYTFKKKFESWMTLNFEDINQEYSHWDFAPVQKVYFVIRFYKMQNGKY